MSESFLNSSFADIISQALLVSAVVYLVVGVICLHYRKTSYALLSSIMMLTGLFYSVGYYFELRSDSLQQAFFWIRVEYIGISFIPFLWIVFLLLYTENTSLLRPWVVGPLFAYSCTTLVIVFTNPMHRLFYTEITPHFIGRYCIIATEKGSWYWFNISYYNIATVFGVLLLLYTYMKSAARDRKRHLLLMLSSIVPWIAMQVYVLDHSPFGLDLGAFSLLITGLMILYTSVSFGLFGLLPIAYSNVFNSITDAIIVFDVRGVICDMNLHAAALFGKKDSIIGQPSQNIFSLLITDGEIAHTDDSLQFEATLPTADGLRNLNVRRLPIVHTSGAQKGSLMIFTDVTLQKQAELSYSTLFSTMIDGFALHEIILDEQGRPVNYRFVDVNPAFETMTGLRREDVCGRTVMELMPDTEEHWIQNYGEIALHGGTMRFSNFSRAVNKYFSVVAYQSGLNHFACIFADITDQRLAETKLQEQQKVMEIILEDTLSGYWYWNLANDTLFFSPAFKKLYGYEEGELDNSLAAINALFLEDDIQIVRKSMTQHFESRGKIPFSCEVRCRHKSGSIIWVICSGRVMDWSDDGKPIKMAGCHVDITRIKQFEETIYEDREKLRITLQSIGDGVIATDNSGRITLMNPIAEQLTGWPWAKAQGQRIDELFSLTNPSTGQKTENPVDKALATKGIVADTGHSILHAKNGTERPVANSAAPIKDKDGYVLGAVLVIRDITENLKQQEEILYLSYHDSLTGLYNRTYLEQALIWADIQANLPLSIIMGDVNGLKLTNDVFGHGQGDELLRTISGILRESCPKNSIISRWGGDEFVILLPRTTNRECYAICEHISANCAAFKSPIIRLSIALGFDTKESPDDRLLDILKTAENYMYKHKLLESRSAHSSIITSLQQTLYEKSNETEAHAIRLAALCKKVGHRLGLSASAMDELELFAKLHDIGKIVIDSKILNKEGPLTHEERLEMQKHPEIGYRIAQSSYEIKHISEYILAHHERWDGKGYPQGLKGEDIPLASRILTIADSYDAMTNDRVYQKGVSHNMALEELSRCAGAQFDPKLVEVFLSTLTENDSMIGKD